ncbi:cytochrome c biogenesis protein ResB [Nocardioides sp. Iso805N]|uniref:cytochrome c biogenesis protein ResB n=1 Tax=Nocardioides sp. Iso805N TaxID=1283287 RepID=UPI000361AC89|nr:cytochrome c biogenesis protein ResB [Nocardioides sp. Iso805N]
MSDLKESAASRAARAERERQHPSPIRELTLRELARWSWRQLTSMRTALLLLLLLALAAVPGSLIPQENIDSVKTTNWQAAHTTLTPVYRRLGLFDVYGTPWFAAIYILLMISLVGCIVPRLAVYWRGLRAQPPAAPRNLGRMPDSASYTTSESAEEVTARARQVLRRKRYRIRREPAADGAISAERGYLREAGNLLFHVSVIVVLVGFAVGSLFGYKGGVNVLVGDQYGFSNELTQYDDFAPGSLFRPSMLNSFDLHIHDFHVDWLQSGPRQGMAKGFKSDLQYQTSTDGATKSYRLEVNHPLDIGGTEVFLIGHGYAPIITVRDAKGNITYSGPQIFLPENQSFLSFGAVKPPTGNVALEGLFYPSALSLSDGSVTNITGDIGDKSAAVLSFQVWTGDVAKANEGQSVYTLNTAGLKQVTAAGGKAFNLHMGQTAKLPDGLGSVTFDDVTRWNKLQISQTPFKHVALGGVTLALIGLLGSLFIRPRRVWVRARETDGGTLVEVAVLDRSGNDEVGVVVSGLVAQLQGRVEEELS